MKNDRASLLRALILAAIAIPAVACGGDDTSSETSATTPGAGGSSAGGSSSGGSAGDGGSAGSSAGAGGAGAGGTAGDGGSAQGGDGGTAGTGGTAGAGGTAGSGGSAGQAGTAGNGGAAGVAGSGGSTAGTAGSGGSAAGSGGAGTGGAAGSGGAGTGGAAGGGGAAGSGGFNNHPCLDPKIIEVGGKPTGYEVCANGAIHRRENLECPSLLPQPKACEQAAQGGNCKSDADCKEAANGYCVGSEGGFEAPGCYCNYGCTKDTDCGDGSICLCGEPVGRCVAATCRSDADCGGGLCNSYGLDQICYNFGFACQSPKDTCGGNNDCQAPQYCLPEGEQRICKEDSPCAIGRPLMVEEGWRFASLARRSDWLAPHPRRPSVPWTCASALRFCCRRGAGPVRSPRPRSPSRPARRSS